MKSGKTMTQKLIDIGCIVTALLIAAAFVLFLFKMVLTRYRMLTVIFGLGIVMNVFLALRRYMGPHTKFVPFVAASLVLTALFVLTL